MQVGNGDRDGRSVVGNCPVGRADTSRNARRNSGHARPDWNGRATGAGRDADRQQHDGRPGNEHQSEQHRWCHAAGNQRGHTGSRRRGRNGHGYRNGDDGQRWCRRFRDDRRTRLPLGPSRTAGPDRTLAQTSVNDHRISGHHHASHALKQRVRLTDRLIGEVGRSRGGLRPTSRLSAMAAGMAMPA
jgi:hypothetical protein